MKAFLSLLRELGFDVILLLAGFAGGIASLNKTSTLTKKQKFISVISGGFIANYLTPVVGHWLNLGEDVLYGLAFILGFGGLKSVETAFSVFTSFANNLNSK